MELPANQYRRNNSIATALVVYLHKPAPGFSDCLILEIARKAGRLPLGTFDRALGRTDGAEII